MRSPNSVCSRGSSHTAHSLPTNVLSRRVLLLSVSNIPDIPPTRFLYSIDLLLAREYEELSEVVDLLEKAREVPAVDAAVTDLSGERRSVATFQITTGTPPIITRLWPRREGSKRRTY